MSKKSSFEFKNNIFRAFQIPLSSSSINFINCIFRCFQLPCFEFEHEYLSISNWTIKNDFIILSSLAWTTSKRLHSSATPLPKKFFLRNLKKDSKSVSNFPFLRPFFDFSAPNFCVIPGNFAVYCVIPTRGGGWGPLPTYGLIYHYR